jgi:hypothetical protein
LVGLKQNVRELLIKENLTRDQKITLLKIKLDAVFNAEYPNKKLALLAILTAIMASIMLVGPYGIMIFLSAIYQLWKEGKISTATAGDTTRLPTIIAILKTFKLRGV